MTGWFLTSPFPLIKLAKKLKEMNKEDFINSEAKRFPLIKLAKKLKVLILGLYKPKPIIVSIN